MPLPCLPRPARHIRSAQLPDETSARPVWNQAQISSGPPSRCQQAGDQPIIDESKARDDRPSCSSRSFLFDLDMSEQTVGAREWGES
jgi:hypothetical protein